MLGPWGRRAGALVAGAQRRSAATSRLLPDDGMTLQDFVAQSRHPGAQLGSSPPSTSSRGGVFMETYGCQMNSADTEVVRSILASAGYSRAESPEQAAVILLNTCAVRDNAEAKIWQRLGYYANLKKGRRRDEPRPVVGVLGCMAERLKQRLLESEKLVDVVAGPDAYRDLPRLIDLVAGGAAVRGGRSAGAMNVQLSADETYADVTPVRDAGARSAYLSIMRGCNNMCAFCIVPYVRGRERSRPLHSILDEVRRRGERGTGTRRPARSLQGWLAGGRRSTRSTRPLWGLPPAPPLASPVMRHFLADCRFVALSCGSGRPTVRARLVFLRHAVRTRRRGSGDPSRTRSGPRASGPRKRLPPATLAHQLPPHSSPHTPRCGRCQTRESRR